MSKNQLKAGALLSYTSMFIGYIISLIYTPIMIRLLGQNEYGLYNLVSSIVAFLGVLNFGFGSTYVRYYIKLKANGDHIGVAKLNGMFLIIFVTIGVISMLASVVLALNAQILFGSKLSISEHNTSRVLLLILTANLAVSFPGIVFSSHISANERFVFQNLINMLRVVVSPFVSLPLLVLGYGSVGLAIATTAVSLLIEASNVYYCLRKLKMRFRFDGFDSQLFRQISKFSFFIFINLVIDQINWSVDKYILGRTLGTISVAVYSLASQINVYYISVSTSISAVFIPRVHKLVVDGQDRELTDLFARIGRIQFLLLAMLAIALVCFGHNFFVLWVGQAYSEAYYIALLLVLPVTVPLIQNIGIEVQRAKNMHQFRSVVYFGIAVLNVILTLLLIKPFGGIGAAMGTAISLLIGNGLIMNCYNHRVVGIDMIVFWKQIGKTVPSLILPVLYGVGIMSLKIEFGWGQLLLVGFLYVIIYTLSVWILGFNEDEKMLFRGPIRRVFDRILPMKR